MANEHTNNIITIDLNEWATQTQYAKETGIKLNTISQQLKRSKENKSANPLVFKEIPELGITLIKR